MQQFFKWSVRYNRDSLTLFISFPVSIVLLTYLSSQNKDKAYWTLFAWCFNPYSIFYWWGHVAAFCIVIPWFSVLRNLSFSGLVLGPVMHIFIYIVSNIFTIFKWDSTFFSDYFWFFTVFLDLLTFVKHWSSWILFFLNNTKFFFCLSKHYFIISENKSTSFILFYFSRSIK